MDDVGVCRWIISCTRERDRIVFQLGTANDNWAVKAATHVYARVLSHFFNSLYVVGGDPLSLKRCSSSAKDVAAIDINMGCPKHFSIQGGMGFALLSNPQVAFEV